MEYYQKRKEEVLSALRVNPQRGLDDEEVRRRRENYGWNEKLGN